MPTPHTITPSVTAMPIPALAPWPRPEDAVDDDEVEPGVVEEIAGVGVAACYCQERVSGR